MTSRDFCYWLQGALELNPNAPLTPEQMVVVRNHLNLVFVHEIDTPDPSGKLQAAHEGKAQPQRPLHPSNPVARC